ncbi:MAG: helix-turn-helix domain-containing protein [Spirochaetaceae bacterium]|jgi:transposase|nr:helix-turn-helix domain-containing protein [Spirochaetaceae bacterium]
MLKPNVKYQVTLTGEERKKLRQLAEERTAEYRIRHAKILLALDSIPENKDWTDKKIAAAYGVSEKTVGNLRKRFVEQGLGRALERKKREVPPVVKIDRSVEARIIALTYTPVPKGRRRWTLRLLADRVIETGILESISSTAIGNLLRKTALHHGYRPNEVRNVYAPR